MISLWALQLIFHQGPFHRFWNLDVDISLYFGDGRTIQTSSNWKPETVKLFMMEPWLNKLEHSGLLCSCGRDQAVAKETRTPFRREAVRDGDLYPPSPPTSFY